MADETQWRSVGKGEGTIVPSAAKSSFLCVCVMFFFFLSPFVNQVLTISCYCVPFQSLSLTTEIEIEGHFRYDFLMFFAYMLTLILFFFFFSFLLRGWRLTLQTISRPSPLTLWGSF